MGRSIQAGCECLQEGLFGVRWSARLQDARDYEDIRSMNMY